MNFTGHIAGGTITAGSLAAGALVYGNTIGTSYTIEDSIRIFSVTLFFSLFPDLDITSIPQRWFYRIIFLLLIILGYTGEFEIATLAAIIAITPILDHHHGWTHNLYSPVFVPLILIIIYDMILMKNNLIFSNPFSAIQLYTQKYFWFFISVMTGWYTHLFLDSKIPFFNNKRGHL